MQNFKLPNRRGSTDLQQSPKTSKENEENSEENPSIENSTSNETEPSKLNETHYFHQLISLFKLKCYFQMNSWKLFDKELKNLINNQNLKLNASKHSYLKAQGFYMLNDYSFCFKHLINTFLNQLSSTTSLNLIQKLKELVHNENKLALLGSNANSVTNDFFLNLVSTCNTITNHINSDVKTNEFDSIQNSFNFILFLNNIGLVHFSLRKYSLSTLYLKQSLNETGKFVNKYLPHKKDNEDINNNTEHDSGKNNLNKLLMNNQHEIMYNLGISLLFNKQPIAAFECLHKSLEQYNQNPRLWLRLAECCIMCYRHSLTNDQTNQFIKFNSTSSANERIFKLSEKIKCIKKIFWCGFSS